VVGQRCGRGGHAGGVRDPGVPGLCRTGGSAPQAGIYGYLLGGVGYALLGSSRQLAIGPTSAISLMIADTVAGMADGDAQRYAQIASLAAMMVALFCLIAWLLRLSILVRLISESGTSDGGRDVQAG
jgi:MFS superfamily sulfate permease-like transporter